MAYCRDCCFSCLCSLSQPWPRVILSGLYQIDSNRQVHRFTVQHSFGMKNRLNLSDKNFAVQSDKASAILYLMASDCSAGYPDPRSTPLGSSALWRRIFPIQIVKNVHFLKVCILVQKSLTQDLCLDFHQSSAAHLSFGKFFQFLSTADGIPPPPFFTKFPNPYKE